MEKDQKRNSETQNNDAEDVKVDQLKNDTHTSTSENHEQTKEITLEEKILELMFWSFSIETYMVWNLIIARC